MNPLEWVRYELFGNSLTSWAAGGALFAVVFFGLLLVRRVLRGRLAKLAKENDVRAIKVAAHVVDRTQGWFLFLFSVYVGTRLWVLPDQVDAVATSIATVVALWQAGLWAAGATLHFIHLRREEEIKEDPGSVAAMDVLSFIVAVGVWSVVLLLILDNLGVNITALIAGLGVGGIAVALAAQNILGDLFASLSIVLDKPFVVGDFLIINEFLGSVEKVGIKTTRLRSLSGEQLIFSNNDLLGSRIRNYGRMFERRIVFSVGVTYQTQAEQLKGIPGILRAAVEAQDNVRFDRAHFQKFGDFALIFEIVYYVTVPDYAVYMNVQQAINLKVFEEFEQAGIQFAYPTQTLYVKQPS